MGAGDIKAACWYEGSSFNNEDGGKQGLGNAAHVSPAGSPKSSITQTQSNYTQPGQQSLLGATFILKHRLFYFIRHSPLLNDIKSLILVLRTIMPSSIGKAMQCFSLNTVVLSLCFCDS